MGCKGYGGSTLGGDNFRYGKSKEEFRGLMLKKCKVKKGNKTDYKLNFSENEEAKLDDGQHEKTFEFDAKNSFLHIIADRNRICVEAVKENKTLAPTIPDSPATSARKSKFGSKTGAKR